MFPLFMENFIDRLVINYKSETKYLEGQLNH